MSVRIDLTQPPQGAPGALVPMDERPDMPREAALTRHCTKCGEIKPYDAFSRSSVNKDGKQHTCKACQREYYVRDRATNPEKLRARGRAYSANNPDKRRESCRRWKAKHLERERERGRRYAAANRDRSKHNRLQRHYGISLEEYQTLVALQNGLCAICGEEERLVVDHDHETGAIRGLICRPCNGGLGLLGDSLDNVKAALAYLERPAVKLRLVKPA